MHFRLYLSVLVPCRVCPVGLGPLSRAIAREYVAAPGLELPTLPHEAQAQRSHSSQVRYSPERGASDGLPCEQLFSRLQD